MKCTHTMRDAKIQYDCDSYLKVHDIGHYNYIYIYILCSFRFLDFRPVLHNVFDYDYDHDFDDIYIYIIYTIFNSYDIYDYDIRHMIQLQLQIRELQGMAWWTESQRQGLKIDLTWRLLR